MSSSRKNSKRGHRRTTSLISRPRPMAFGISTPPSLETEVAMGSFTPIHSAFPRLTNLITSCYPGSTPSGYSRRRLRSMFEWPDAHSESGGSDTSSVPASPTSSLRSSFAPIPGISRTSSLDSNSYSCSLSDEPFHRKHSEMNPILSELERRSKLCNTIVGCATCGKLGSDYPRCGNCGEMWCSRSCRLRDGKKHICASKAS
ncbi:hypothetical protein BDP27DRAFT_483019 [Rhodocollybia butyracea]|uniref:HIT-type domain-containing protein n=1 Tax=Rhodocollybia butyracea TaxID=206335 RepID=A0A9P5QB03_9AGAR|nr:hypothetical protein BDP27DRAFT_483019 [Rhodocollybia butyracea]